jgi:hypothetical protein
MKHAGPDTLDRLEPLLRELRRRVGLKERSRGIFFRRSNAFLHFHEHGPEFFADMRVGHDFERFAATKATEQKALLRLVDAALADGSGTKPR